MTGKEGANKGKTFSEETKKLMSDFMKKRHSQPDYINPTKGKPRSDEVKEALKQAHSNGIYITPWGNFISTPDAVKHPGSLFRDAGAIRDRCKKKIQGYDFIPKS